MKRVSELDEDTRLALRGVEIDEGGVVKVRFPEKTAAREQAMRHFGLYERDKEQKPAVEVHLEGAKIEFTPIPETRKG